MNLVCAFNSDLSFVNLWLFDQVEKSSPKISQKIFFRTILIKVQGLKNNLSQERFMIHIVL